MTRAEELTLRLIDGDLSAADADELAALVATDPTAAAEHLSLLELEAELRGVRTDLDLTDGVMNRVRRMREERTTRGVMADIAALPAPPWAARRKERRRARVAVVVGVAAAVFLGVWLARVDRSPDAPEFVGEFPTLKGVSGSVELLAPGGEAVPAEAGRRLGPGHTLRTVGEESLAVVELPDRTRFELEPDTVVKFADGPSRGKLFLASGQLTAAVASRPANMPLVVSTSVGDVLARGGKFVLASAGPESARVDIREGDVQVVRPAAPKPVAVGGGLSALMHANVERVTIERHQRIDATPRRSLAFPGARAVTFAPDGKEIWAATPRTFLRWTPDGGTAEHIFPPRKGGDLAAGFLADKSALLTLRSDKDEPLVVRNTPSCEDRAALPIRLPEARYWAAAPDGRWVAVAGEPKPNQKRVRIHDGTTGPERFSFEAEDQVTTVAAAPDGKRLAIGITESARGANNKIVMLDPDTGERQFALPTQKRGVFSLAFSADGRFLAAGFNGLVQVWDVRSRELVRSIAGFERLPILLAFAPDGSRLAGATQDGLVWVWNTSSGRPVQQLDLGGRGIRALTFSPDGRSILTAGGLHPVAVWAVAPVTPAEAELQ